MLKKKSLVYIMLIAAIGLLWGCMCGCSAENASTDSVIKIYEVKSDGSGLTSYDYRLKGLNTGDQVDEILAALSVPSDKLVYKTAIGETFELLSYDLAVDQLSLNFSDKYWIQDKVTEILNRAAIVRTIGQIEGISGISFFVKGEALTDINQNPIGIMTPEQFIFNADKEINAYEKAELTLYFADSTGTKLTEVKRSVVYSSNISLEKMVVDELIKGPGADEAGMATINPKCKAFSTTVTDGICYVNLDPEFLNVTDAVVTPEVTIYSIVNSLVELPNINKVSISIDGDNSTVYREIIPLSTVFERNLDIM